MSRQHGERKGVASFPGSASASASGCVCRGDVGFCSEGVCVSIGREGQQIVPRKKKKLKLGRNDRRMHSTKKLRL